MSDFKLPPLEYCRLDRASRLIGCEVEDFIHWHEVGSIQLCVHFESADDIQSGISAFNLMKLYEEGVKADGGFYRLSKHSSISIIPEDGNPPPPIEFFNNPDNGKKLLHYIPHARNHYTSKVQFAGFWRLIPTGFTQSGKNTDICVYNESTDYTGDNFNNSFVMKDKEFKIDELFIMNSEIEKLINSNGKSLPNYINGGIPTPEINSNEKEIRKTHGNQEINSSKREKILLAAMYLMKNHPEECLRKNGKESFAATAKAICNHSYSLFGSEEPPITNVRIISEIIADGYRLPKERKRAGRLD